MPLINLLDRLWKEQKDPLVLLIIAQIFYITIGIPLLDFHLGWIEVVVAVLAAIMSEFAFASLCEKKKSFFVPKSAIAAGFGIAIFFRASSPVYFALASFLAIASKYLIPSPFEEGKHVFNPSNFGIVLLVFLFPIATTIEFTQWGNNPYLYVAITLISFFIAYRAGVLHTTLTFLASYLLILTISVSFKPDTFIPHHYGLLGPSLILFASFMITDPKSS